MIVIENIQSVGPWGVSRGLGSSLKKQLFTDNLLELPWQYSRKSLEDQILADQLDGKIKNELSFKIFQLVSIVLENAMEILGVSLPKKM